MFLSILSGRVFVPQYLKTAQAVLVNNDMKSSDKTGIKELAFGENDNFVTEKNTKFISNLIDEIFVTF